jgi:radical SAM superfamily enzyme YgiQ (UPF0313 family)
LSRINKVSLIEPRAPGYHVYSRFPLPRLGLPILGAILKRRGVDVSIYCQDFHPIDYVDVLSSDLVGISTTTSTAPEAYRIARRVKEVGIPVVVGGPHVTFLPDEALAHADFCVRGEGEDTFPELIDALDAGSGFDSIAGLSYRADGECRHNPDRGLVKDLDLLPMPDLSLIKAHEKIGICPIITSRGCPYDCSFCSVTAMFGRACRYRDPDSVIEELRTRNQKMIFFYDDNFCSDRKHTTAVLERMLSTGIARTWSAQVRADITRDRELIKLFARSKCWVLYIGFESASAETLAEYNKRQTVEEMAEAVRILHENGILVHGMFVLGAESDTTAGIRETVDFAIRHKMDTVQFMALTPLPGTAYYRELERQNRLLTRDWQLYDGHHVVFAPRNMSAYELQREAFRGMKRFYSLRECVRMLFGLGFVKFLARLNLSLLLGRWRRAKWEFDTRVRKWAYTGYGHFLIRRVEAASKEWTQVLAGAARRIRGSLRPPEKVEDNARSHQAD